VAGRVVGEREVVAGVVVDVARRLLVDHVERAAVVEFAGVGEVAVAVEVQAVQVPVAGLGQRPAFVLRVRPDARPAPRAMASKWRRTLSVFATTAPFIATFPPALVPTALLAALSIGLPWLSGALVNTTFQRVTPFTKMRRSRDTRDS